MYLKQRSMSKINCLGLIVKVPSKHIMMDQYKSVKICNHFI